MPNSFRSDLSRIFYLYRHIRVADPFNFDACSTILNVLHNRGLLCDSLNGFDENRVTNFYLAAGFNVCVNAHMALEQVDHSPGHFWILAKTE